MDWSRDPLWYSTTTAARLLGLTPRTRYRLINAGDLPAYRFGRVIRIKAADLEAFIDALRIEPST